MDAKFFFFFFKVVTTVSSIRTQGKSIDDKYVSQFNIHFSEDGNNFTRYKTYNEKTVRHYEIDRRYKLSSERFALLIFRRYKSFPVT